MPYNDNTAQYRRVGNEAYSNVCGQMKHEVPAFITTRVAQQHQSLLSSWTPEAFYTRFYNHAHRLRLEKLLFRRFFF